MIIAAINYKLIILVVAAIMNVLMLFAIYNQNPRSATNRSFAIFSLVVTLWLLASYFSTTPETNLIWARVTIFFASLMTMLFLLFAHTLPNKKFQFSKKQGFIVGISTAMVMLVTISPYAFVGVEIKDGVKQLVVGPGMAAFGLLATAWSGTTIYVLWKKLRTLSAGLPKEQVRFVLIGALIMLFFLVTGVMLPVIIANDDTSVSLIPLFTLVFLGMSAYAIARYRFLDIRLIVARAISYTILVAIIAAIYTGILFIITGFILGFPFDASVVLVGVVLSTIIALTFGYFRGHIERITDRVLFRGRYDSDELLSKLTHTMAATIDLDGLTNSVLGTLVKEMRITKAAFLLVDKHKIVDIKGVKYKDHSLADPRLEELIHTEEGLLKKPIAFEDLEDENIKDLFREHDISVSVPIVVEKEEVALLVLGRKSSGEIYAARDLTLLGIFAAEAGVAIQNAKAYTEIKKFSEKLEVRVEERTAELEKSQERELAKAKEVSKLKDEFVFIAAHELRTPVTAIKGFLELVSEKTKEFPKDVQEHLDAIASASTNLTQLVNDLLEIARSDAGTMKVNVEPTDIVPLVEKTVKELSPIADKKKVKVVVNPHGEMPKVMADPQKGKEVVTNLLSNAIKYNKEGGSVNISMFVQGKNMLVEFRDTGYGIPKDQQEKVFQKFFRATSKDTQDITGTGLGLFLVRMLVEKMGGKMLFSSVEGGGSTFTFSLPKA